MERKNEPISGLLHLIGIGLAITALVLLALNAEGIRQITTVTIFGISLILVYLASTLYHLVPLTPRNKEIFRLIDHAMIYILIAGTYTPVCLIALRGGWGWSLFGAIWSLALLGIILKTTGFNIAQLTSTLIYLIMGWLIVIAFIPLINSIPGQGMIWLVVGGLLYTTGTIFYGLDIVIPKAKWFGMHEIWHLFVLAGSFCHFWAILKYILSAY